MAVTATYLGDLSRVRITANGLGSAQSARVERSLNGTTWETVRGGTDVPVTAGALAVPVDDYEFAPNVINHYRVVYWATPTYVGTGTVDHDTNAPTTPGIAPGTLGGDTLIAISAIRNYGTGSPDPATDWGLILNVGSLRIYGKTAAGPVGGATTEPVPTFPYTGGVAGAVTSAAVITLRGVTLPYITGSAAGHTSVGQNMAYPAVPAADPVQPLALELIAAAKGSGWTSAALAGYTEALDSASSTTSAGQGIAAYVRAQTTPDAVPAGSITVTGGVSAQSITVTALFAPASAVQQTSITPVLDQVWLKSIATPALNRPVVVHTIGPIQRPARMAVHEVKGRPLPIAITGRRGSRRLPGFVLLTDSVEEREELDTILSAGVPMFLHSPDPALPTMHVVIDTTTEDRNRNDARQRHFALPLIQVAPPAASVVGATATWQTVIDIYATWADVFAAHTDWASVLDLVGSPDDVVVD